MQNDTSSDDETFSLKSYTITAPQINRRLSISSQDLRDAGLSKNQDISDVNTSKYNLRSRNVKIANVSQKTILNDCSSSSNEVICCYCNKDFASQRALNRHIKEIHSDLISDIPQVNQKCQICGKICKNANIHIAKSHPSKNRDKVASKYTSDNGIPQPDHEAPLPKNDNPQIKLINEQLLLSYEKFIKIADSPRNVENFEQEINNLFEILKNAIHVLPGPKHPSCKFYQKRRSGAKRIDNRNYKQSTNPMKADKKAKQRSKDKYEYEIAQFQYANCRRKLKHKIFNTTANNCKIETDIIEKYFYNAFGNENDKSLRHYNNYNHRGEPFHFTEDIIVEAIKGIAIDTSQGPDELPSGTSSILCAEGYFQCPNTTVCIPQIQNCDGQFDCENGSDEWDCADAEGSKYWDHLFRKNPSAEHDDLDETCALDYNGPCVCRSKVILCQHRNLKRAPDDLPHSEIDMLDFSGSSFGVLTPGSLKTLPLQVNSLVLRQCAITELHTETFHQLPTLESLYLDNNELQTFPANVFPKRNELTTLVIRRNRLSHVDINAFQYLNDLTELDLSYNQLTEIRREMLEPLIKLEILYLNANRIRSISIETFPPLSLMTLSLADNYLEELNPGTFSSAPTLKNLFLSDNRIKFLTNGTFSNLNQLVSLNLQGNGIEFIEMGVFHDVRNLTSMYLGNNAFRKLPKNLLQPLMKLQYIYFDRFEMCLTATHVRVCEPKGDGISSQEHLLDNTLLRTSVWIMGAVGCCGNLIVLLGRLIAPTNNVVHSLYIRNLALSDLLMGIYLFTIASADHHYRGVYLQYEYDWRHSKLCNICGFLSTLSCESSVLILSLVTWDRFISVTQPLARKQPSPKAAFFTLVFLWMIAVSVSVAPLTTVAGTYFGDEFYGSNGVCLSLHIHDPYDNGWEYSAAMFIFVNTIALVFICYAYFRMIREIRASTIACRSTRQNHDRDKVAQRFGVIVLTDCLCWVPVILVKLAALSGLRISEALYAWLAILVLPINSALNPVLYTLTTTVFIKQIQKIVNSRIFKSKFSEHQNSDSAHSSSFLPRGNGSRRSMFHRGTQSSVTTSRTSWKQSTAV